MLSVAYREALVELLEILKYTDQNYVNKIPKQLLKFFKENASTTYKFTMDESKEIKDLKLKKETKGLLSMVYRNYWCTPEERAEYDKLLLNNQKLFEAELREKYNPDKIFENSKYQIQQETSSNQSQNEPVSDESTSLTNYNSNIFTQILNKIKLIVNNIIHSKKQ